MSHNQERTLGKRRGSDIDEGQGLASHDIGLTSPKPSSPSEEPDSRIFRGYCGGGGIKPGSPCQCLRWAQDLIQGRPTPWPWEGPSSAINVAEEKGRNLVLVITFRVISPNKKSTKTTKNKGKTAITAIKYSTPNRAILFSFYNHTQPLWVWTDGTSISHIKLNLYVDVREREKS